MSITYICHVDYRDRDGNSVEDTLVLDAPNVTDAIAAACKRISAIGGRNINVTPVKQPEHEVRGFAAHVAARRAAE